MLRLSLVGAISTIAAVSLGIGPTSRLYITNYGEFSGGNETGLDVVQGLSETSYNTADNIDICIAVSGDVRTMGYSTSTWGDRFDLAGNPQVGGPYMNTIQNSQLHDGTSDGAYNYSVDYTTGDLIQFDRNWATPTVLFNAGTNLPGAGWITMDVTDGSFWISQWGGPDQVQHVTHGGTVLSTFSTGLVANTGLALDPVDGTLWMSNVNGFSLYQYSQSGSLLQTVNYGGVQGSWYGMEFDTRAVPEPSLAAVLGLGLLSLWRRKRASRVS